MTVNFLQQEVVFLNLGGEKSVVILDANFKPIKKYSHQDAVQSLCFNQYNMFCNILEICRLSSKTINFMLDQVLGDSTLSSRASTSFQ